MKKAVLICPFDPITSSELDYAKHLVKKHGLYTLFLVPFGNGICTMAARRKMLETAIAPYRHLELCDQVRKEDIVYSYDDAEKDEEKVRTGSFFLAPKAVRQIMNENGWYYECVARANCKPHRYTHSVGVAKTARTIAIAHHMDPLEAYKAGLLHDVTKAWSDAKSRKVIARDMPEWLTMSPKIWHSYTAVVFCRQQLDLHDDRILHAIAHHTLGDGQSDLDKVLYIADKIEPGRGYDTTKEMNLALQDLDQAAALIMQESKAYREEKEGLDV